MSINQNEYSSLNAGARTPDKLVESPQMKERYNYM